MIVQTAAAGEPHFVIMQADHARASGQFAAAFGNGQFARPAAFAQMVFITAHHDEGWLAVDGNPLQDPDTGLPYHLTKTPIERLIATGPRSPDFNQKQHAYCGLLSSMHTYGLYHGRYGLSDKIVIDSFPTAHRPTVDAMLAAELDRQAQLKADLQADPATAEWVSEAVLFQHYKLLQFFDTLALYFHTTHAAARIESHFLHVPLSPNEDATLTITPLDDGRYRLAPYPFAQPELVFSTQGRYLNPHPAGADIAAIMMASPVTEQREILVA